jgi:hypothetical protein
MKRSDATTAAPHAPRFALGWAALTYAVAALTLGWPALAGKFLVSPVSDQFKAGYAFREFAAHALKTTGSFPQWDPYLFGGLPYVAGMHGDIFYPTFLLRWLLPTDVAMTWSFIVHVFLAGVFTYLFLRAWRLGFAASLTGGLAYMMGGPIAAYVSPGHDGKLYVSALFPLVLLLLARGIRDGKRWSWGVLAFVIGMAVLSPHPQLLQYLLLAAGAFALYLAFSESGKGKLPRRTAFTRLGFAAGAVALGFLIGAVQYVPVMEYVSWSPRAGGFGDYERATSYSFPPEELINVYLPQFSGILDNYWGRNRIHLHSEYLGAVVLLLAGLGLATAKRSDKRHGFAWFWGGAFIVALLWSMGGFTPFFHLVYALVPGTKYFRAPSTMMFVMAFAVAVFAALGVEEVAAARVTTKYAIGWFVAAGIVAVLALTGALTNMAGALAPEGSYDTAIANGPQIVFGAIRSLVCVALAAGVIFSVATHRIKPLAGAYVLAALVAADLWSVEKMYWRFSEPASKIFASDAITDLLSKLDQPSRVLATPMERTMAGFRDPSLTGDGLMPHRIRTLTGYHGNELGRYATLVEQPGNPQVWRLLNVQYLLTNSGTSPAPELKPVLGPVVNGVGDTLYLYRLAVRNPFAWVAPVIVKGPDAAVLSTLMDPRFDISRAALFDTAAPVRAQQITKLPDSTGIAVTTTRYEPGRIAVELARPAPAGSALVVSENFYPGWTATVDGKPAAIGRADYVLIGVELPAGAKKVELAFASSAYEKGKMITLFALIVAAALAVGGAALDRRKSDG